MILQGFTYYTGYLAKWSGTKELKDKSQPNPEFATKSAHLTIDDATESLAPWIFLISKGGLAVPKNQFLMDVERMEKEFVFWINNRTIRINANDEEYILAHYESNVAAPRPGNIRLFWEYQNRNTQFLSTF